MEATKEAVSPLLDLPDPCLLAVMRCLAADRSLRNHRGLFSAARAHSRLHQAAVLALSSVTAAVKSQQQADKLALYLDKSAQHVSSMFLRGDEDELAATLHQLPSSLQLDSLGLDSLRVQLQPGNGFAGVVMPGLPSKQLELNFCILLDGEDGLAAALQQLPELEHLSLDGIRDGDCGDTGHDFAFSFTSTDMLREQQRLTYLELCCVWLPDPGPASLALQGLQCLTSLLDLRLTEILGEDDSSLWARVDTGVLASYRHLTRLDLMGCLVCEPGVLAGKAQLQHLHWACKPWAMPDGSAAAAGVVGLLSQLQHLPLTHLTFDSEQQEEEGQEEPTPPAAAYGTLTASSKLQKLNIRWCTLPADAWAHVFPAGRRLLQLTALDITGVREPSGDFAAMPDGTRLVSCCPSLRSLDMQRLQTTAALLAPLQGLSSLQFLSWRIPSSADSKQILESCQSIAQLAGLQELTLDAHMPQAASLSEGLLLQLTRLQKLTSLSYPSVSEYDCVHLTCKGADDEPVWRQLLRRHLQHSDQAVVQRAAAALAQ